MTVMMSHVFEQDVLVVTVVRPTPASAVGPLCSLRSAI